MYAMGLAILEVWLLATVPSVQRQTPRAARTESWELRRSSLGTIEHLVQLSHLLCECGQAGAQTRQGTAEFSFPVTKGHRGKPDLLRPSASTSKEP